jgi:hypothetical protein
VVIVVVVIVPVGNGVVTGAAWTTWLEAADGGAATTALTRVALPPDVLVFVRQGMAMCQCVLLCVCVCALAHGTCFPKNQSSTHTRIKPHRW